MNTKIFHGLRVLLSVLLFTAALWVLHRELRAYHLRDIIHNFGEIPTKRLLAAGAFAFLSYLTLTFYDFLGLRYVNNSLPYRRIAPTSFIAYAFSNNLGMSVLTGGSVRYRFYTAWGLSTIDVAKIIGFCILTFWLGFLTLAGVSLVSQPVRLSASLGLPATATLGLGVFFLVMVAMYLLASLLKRTPIKVFDWDFSLPPLRIALPQAFVGFMDWTLAASVLYWLLPPLPGLTFPSYVGIFLVAQLAGFASQVPGGLGVFESIVILLLPPNFSSSDAAAILLAYRIVYYLTPLSIAAVLLGGLEFLQQRRLVQRFALAAGRQISGAAALLFSIATFVAGALLLFYGALPISSWRLDWLQDVVPLSVLEASHFLGSLVGMALLLVARGLQLRLDAAYFIALFFLASGVVFSLLGGFHPHQAFILLLLFFILLPSRRYFYRKASLLSEPFSAQWIGAVVIVLLSSIWLGVFSYKHIQYSGSLWWRFTFSGNAPRFLRATVGAIGVGLFFTIAKLLRPARPQPVVLQENSFEKVKRIVENWPKANANLAFLGDKAFLFNDAETAFIMYGVEGRSWVALGDPIGPQGDMVELAWQFQERSDRFGGWSVFYQVDPENLPIYLDLGLALLKLGEEARVRLDTFSLEGAARKGLRYVKNKVEKTGCVFEIIPPENVPALLPALKDISDAWLIGKNTREKRFSLGFFSEDYIKLFPIGVVKRNNELLAFANILSGAEKEEVTIDLMRYLSTAPSNVMEYLFIQLILWGKQQGYHWFNLGMAPLSGFEARALAPFWTRFGALVYRYGEHFYNLQGLRQYKEKFSPEWRPKYLASPGGLALPRILTNVASLISGGISGIVRR